MYTRCRGQNEVQAIKRVKPLQAVLSCVLVAGSESDDNLFLAYREDDQLVACVEQAVRHSAEWNVLRVKSTPDERPC